MQNLYDSSSVTVLSFSQTFTLPIKAGLVLNILDALAGTSALKKPQKLLWGTTFNLVFFFFNQANLYKLK